MHELSVDARHVEEAQLRARAQPRILQRAGDGRVQGLGVDVHQDQLLEGLGQLDEGQVERLPGPENDGQPASPRVADDVLDEGAVLLGVRPPSLSVLALALADSHRGLAEEQLGEGVGVDAGVEDPAGLARLGNQGKGGQRVAQVDLGHSGIELTEADHRPREVHEDFEVFVGAWARAGQHLAQVLGLRQRDRGLRLRKRDLADVPGEGSVDGEDGGGDAGIGRQQPRHLTLRAPRSDTSSRGPAVGLSLAHGAGALRRPRRSPSTSTTCT